MQCKEKITKIVLVSAYVTAVTSQDIMSKAVIRKKAV